MNLSNAAKLSLAMRMTGSEGGPWIGEVQELSLRLMPTSRSELLLGRAPRRFGSGVLGNLLLGRSAPPLWQLAAKRTRATEPLASRWQRGWSGEAFLALLDDDHRRIPDPLLMGARVSVYPIAEIGLSVTRTILFGGKDRTRLLTAGDLLDILLARGENVKGKRGPDDSDQKLSYLVEARLPARWAARIGIESADAFYEYAGEDAVKNLVPTARARHFGGGIGIGGASIRGELASTHTGANRWYTHTVYGDAYAYRGFPLGLPMGGDANSFLGRASFPPIAVGTRSLTPSLFARIERFGIYSRVNERRRSLGGAIELRACEIPRDRLLLSMEGMRRSAHRREPRAPKPIVSELRFAYTRAFE